MRNYKFMRNELSDDYGILKLQDKILEIMVYIDLFCKENGITYYLMGGSALGAVRHGGFIPWDDDMDIFMPYKDYIRFQKLCETRLDTERFYLQKEDTAENPYFFSKLRMNGTTCLNPVLNIGHQGVFVDIMCLNNAAPNEFLKKIQYYAAGLLKARAVTLTNYHTDCPKKKIELFISKIIVNGFIKKSLLKIVRKYNRKPTKEVAHLFGRAKYNNSFYDAAYFGKGRIVPFEQVDLAVPYKVEDYLAKRYGKNYMDLPDEDTKQIYQSHVLEWNTDIDYKSYLSQKVKQI